MITYEVEEYFKFSDKKTCVFASPDLTEALNYYKSFPSSQNSEIRLIKNDDREETLLRKKVARVIEIVETKYLDMFESI